MISMKFLFFQLFILLIEYKYIELKNTTIAKITTRTTSRISTIRSTTKSSKKVDDAYLKYSNRRFNEWTWLVSHNSPLNWVDNNVIHYASNQNSSIDQQLKDGVRGFMLDIDLKQCSDFEKMFSNCNCEGICMCHGECDGSPLKDGFAVKNLEYALRKFTNFLMKNRNEIICIFLENYVIETKDLQKSFSKVKNFNSLVFDPYSEEWNVKTKGWPKIIDMIKANKRILIFDDEKRGNHAGEKPGFIRNRDFMIGNMSFLIKFNVLFILINISKKKIITNGLKMNMNGI
jgi:hypothetical protein